MKENERFISRRGTTPEQKKDAEELIAGLREVMQEPFEGEYEKSEEQGRFIVKADKHIGEELQRLGLPPAIQIVPERFHILPDETYETLITDSTWPCGFYISSEAAAYLRGDMPRLYIFKTIMHEAVHMASYHAHEIKKKKDNARPTVGEYRSGYYIKSTDRFLRFNEGVTDLITQEFLRAHREELEKDFPIGAKEASAAPVAYYDFEMGLIKKIIERISEKGGKMQEAVWDKIKTGFFSGHMMHLREVERFFGPGALIVLAALDDDIPPGLSGNEPEELAMKFFSTDDEAEKEEIAQKLLGGRKEDLQAYLKRRRAEH
ncbi:MAG: hypothetical protein HYW91_00900 [Candidatus Sungbacteria bacterium]|nr:hypothetical protein [Candidatus Sungbacteria bacterium]